ncbi:hypothetical protein [uncultured Pluralibacter sp.]|uniref:hypothetical protein n=1 Tax=uncultured Pluralibacter sp. TaxID=1490864 RepID=UPI0026131A44|nr:hypothetical protein [uncultured Pluralibacter sp.]
MELKIFFKTLMLHVDKKSCMFMGKVILRTVIYVKKSLVFITCFIVSCLLTIYGMPLNKLMLKAVDYSYQCCGRYLAENYEYGTDPVSFMAIVVTNIGLAIVLMFLVRVVRRGVCGFL